MIIILMWFGRSKYCISLLHYLDQKSRIYFGETYSGSNIKDEAKSRGSVAVHQVQRLLLWEVV